MKSLKELINYTAVTPENAKLINKTCYTLMISKNIMGVDDKATKILINNLNYYIEKDQNHKEILAQTVAFHFLDKVQQLVINKAKENVGL